MGMGKGINILFFLTYIMMIVGNKTNLRGSQVWNVTLPNIQTTENY